MHPGNDGRIMISEYSSLFYMMKLDVLRNVLPFSNEQDGGN